mgnify:CR=1 FL=1
MSYESDQDKWIKEVGLRVGDKVLVVASAESHTYGWHNSWNTDDMRAGETLEVGEIYQNGEACLGIGLRVPNGSQDIYGFPFFVLVKIN